MCEKIMLHNFYGIREIWMFVSNIRFRNIMINWIIKNYVMFLLTKMVFSCCVCCKHILVKRIPYHYNMQNLGIKIATNSCYIYIYIYINAFFLQSICCLQKPQSPSQSTWISNPKLNQVLSAIELWFPRSLFWSEVLPDKGVNYIYIIYTHQQSRKHSSWCLKNNNIFGILS